MAGNEYFIGNELDMLSDFNNIVYETLKEIKNKPDVTWMERFAFKKK